MNLEEFKKDKEEKVSKRKNLIQSIENDKETLVTLENEYKEALLTDNDKQADSLFPQIEQLKEQIKRNEHKSHTLQVIYNDGIKENALKTVLEVEKIKKEYQSKADELDEEMKPLLEKRKQLLQKGESLYNEFNEIKAEYMTLADQYSLNIKELNKKGVPYAKLELFKDTQANIQVATKLNRAVQRREQKQSLPENATFEQRANAKRITD